MATEVATGYVSIIPSLKGFAAKLQAQTVGASAAAGASSGAAYSAAFGKAGMKMTKMLTIPLLAVGAAGIAATREVEKGLDEVTARTGATGDALKGLQGSFKRVAGTATQDMKTTGQVVGELNTRLGLSGKPLEDLSTKMLNLARVSGEDATDATIQITRAMKDAGVSAKDAGGFMDMLLRASQKTGIGVNELAEKMYRFGSPMRQLGFSTEQTAAMLGSFDSAGVNTDLVMGSLRISLGKMSSAYADLPTYQRRAQEAQEKYTEAVAEYGPKSDEARKASFELTKAQKDLAFAQGAGDIPGAFRDQVKSIKNMKNASAAAATAVELFGAEAGPDMAAAIREGRMSVDDLVDSLKKSGGTLDSTVKETETFSEKWARLTNGLTVSASTIGDALMPALEGAADMLSKVVGWFSNLNPGVLKAVTYVGLLAAAIGPLLMVMSAIVSPFTKLVWVVKQAIVVAKALAIAVQLVGRAFMSLLVSNPIGWVVLAIAALVAIVVLLWNKNEAFRNAIIAIWEAIKKAAAVVWGWISDYLSAVWETIRAAVDVVWPAIQKIIEIVWAAIRKYVEVYTAIVRKVVETVWGAIKAVTDTVWPAIQKIIEVVWAGIRLYVTTYINAVRAIVETVWNALKAATSVAWSFIKAAIIDPIRAVWGVLSGILSALQENLSAGWAVIRERASNAWQNVKSAITTPIGNVWNALSGYVATIRSSLSDAWSAIRDRASTAWDNVKSAITSPIASLWDAMKDLLGVGNGGKIGTTGALGRLVGAFTAVVSTIKSVFGGITEAIVSPIAAAFKWVNDNVIEKLNTNVLSKFGDLRIPKLPIPQYATGGLVRGPGSGTSDSILARLSDGEYVVNAKAAAANYGTLEAMNAGRAQVSNSQTGGGLPNPISWVGGLFRKGAETVIKSFGAAALASMRPVFGGSFGGEFAMSGVSTLVDSVAAWGKEQTTAPTALMEWMASRFEDMQGTFVGVSTCLKNVRIALEAAGSKFGFGVPLGAPAWQGTAKAAANQLSGVARRTREPRGSIGLWNYEPSGHTAVMDGKGNFINNYGGPNVVKTSLANARNGYQGWVTPLEMAGRYDNGGWLKPGLTVAMNATGKPEPVFTANQWSKIDQLVSLPPSVSGGRFLAADGGGGTSGGVVNHWHVETTTEPTEDATLRVWRQWEALRGV